MKSAIIIDDEKHARSALRHEIEHHCPELRLVGEAASVSEAVELIEKLNPKVIFLDIKLSDGFGFDVLNNAEVSSADVIITSAYSEYALKAIKANVTDYLLKPVDANDLKTAIAKILKNTGKKGEIVSEKTQYNQQNKITFHTPDGIFIVQIADIISCTSYGNYCFVNCKGGKRIMVSKTMKELELQFTEYGFERVHHSYIVNMSQTISYKSKQGSELLMSDNSVIPVSIRKKARLLARLEELNNK
ncbi:MAG: LytR/AlgR family response regulator transcription factor [Chitinophagales bacterium]